MASGSWWDWVPTLLKVGTTAWGASQHANATQAAAQTAANATNAATDAQLQGLELTRQTMQQQQAAASPGLVTMQNMITRGPGLTPVQQTALDEARRTTLDSLRGSGLRGSARATAATVKKVEGDMRNQYINANQNRADQAAQTLSGQYFNAGNNIANLQSKAGTAVSQGLTTVGVLNASAQLGTANTTGKAVGDIGAIIADEIKNNQKRESSYDDTAKGV